MVIVNFETILTPRKCFVQQNMDLSTGSTNYSTVASLQCDYVRTYTDFYNQLSNFHERGRHL